MHNTMDQSWVKDHSKEYCLNLADRKCREDLESYFGTATTETPLLSVPTLSVCLLIETIVLLRVCRKMSFQLTCLHICEL